MASGPLFGFKACLPVNSSLEQSRDVVVRFLRAHPELRHLVAVSLVARALAEAFPCK
jgi:hypothetical protein